MRASTNRTAMSIRRLTAMNGVIQTTKRRRNGVANILAELTQNERRNLQQQALAILHPAISSPTEDQENAFSGENDTLSHVNTAQETSQGQTYSVRRRRNAMANIMVNVSEEAIDELREQAVSNRHPLTMVTTTPGSTMARRASITYADSASSNNNSLPLDDLDTLSLTRGAVRRLSLGTISLNADQAVPETPASPWSADSLQPRPSLHSTSAPDFAVTADQAMEVTEKDGDLYREKLLKSSKNFRMRRNAVCHENSTQEFLNLILNAAENARRAKKEKALRKQ